MWAALLSALPNKAGLLKLGAPILFLALYAWVFYLLGQLHNEQAGGVARDAALRSQVARGIEIDEELRVEFAALDEKMKGLRNDLKNLPDRPECRHPADFVRMLNETAVLPDIEPDG